MTESQEQNKLTVSYRFSRRLNLGNYESCEAEAFVSAQVDAEEYDPEVLGQQLYDHAQSIVYQSLKEEAEANQNVPVVLKRKLTGVDSDSEQVTVKNPQGTRNGQYVF